MHSPNYGQRVLETGIGGQQNRLCIHQVATCRMPSSGNIQVSSNCSLAHMEGSLRKPTNCMQTDLPESFSLFTAFGFL